MSILSRFGFVFVFLFISISCFALNDRSLVIKSKLEELSVTVPALNDSVNISVNGASIQEFLRAIAIADKVNISIDPKINYSVVNNFSNVKFLDILVFLIDEYNLDVKIIGNIISIIKYSEPVIPPQKPQPRILDIHYADSLISLDLRADSLVNVAKTVTQLTGLNIVITAELQNECVSGYILKSKVSAAIEKIALANGIVCQKSKDGFYILSKSTQNQQQNSSSRKRNDDTPRSNNADDTQYLLDITVVNSNSISVYALNAPVDSIVRYISDKLGINYHLVSKLSDNVSLLFNHISYDKLLDFIFDGKEYSYRKVDGIYIIGGKNLTEIQETKIIQLQYRTVDAISKIFPANLKTGLEIIEFAELNSLLVTGTSEKIRDFAAFVNNIDKLVPVILIEVMIVESKKTSGVSTGLSAGFGENPSKSSVLLSNTDKASGGLNFSFGASSINNLLSGLTGFSNLNIGKVSESFYLNIAALETDGHIKIRSTPKLSTLSGHEAQLTSGETAYYIDETISTTATQSINERYTKQYKPVNADLTISIKPIVSGDNQITLDIDVKQSDFTGTIEKNAPPGTINRSFKSIIRVKDQEMVLLGGLDKNYSNSSGSGIPFLSKIPVIKWFFSSRKLDKQFNKLNIFIKPTVIN